jgi:hypothetical protein
MKASVASLLAFGVSLSLLGCADDTTTEIDSRVTVVPADARVEVTPDQLIFDRAGNDLLAARRAGDIVVSAAGEGYLRSITKVTTDGDRVILDTVPADLSEAVLSGQVAESMTLNAEGKADTHTLTPIELALHDLKPVDTGSLTLTVHEAALSMQPIIDLDLDMDGRHLEEFEAVLRTEIEASLDFEVRARAGTTLSQGYRLWKSPPMVFHQMIGPVPLVETVTISVGVDLSVTARSDASVRVQGHLNSDLEGGVRFDDGRWQRVASASKELTGAIPVDGDIDVRAGLYARVDVKFYGLVGPYLKVEPYVQVTHEDLSGVSGDVGLFGEFGGELNLFGYKVPVLPTFTLFDVSVPAF